MIGEEFILMTLPKVVADLIAGVAPVDQPPEMTVSEAAEWLFHTYPSAWKEAGEKARQAAAKRLLFARWLIERGERCPMQAEHRSAPGEAVTTAAVDLCRAALWPELTMGGGGY